VRVVHYLNQFFGGIGGEDQADAPVAVHAGPVGPGRLLQAKLGDAGTVVATVTCGDNRAQRDGEATGDEIVRLAAEHAPDVILAGPAFGSGRYGLACASVVSAARRAGLPALASMHAENPGVAFCPIEVPIAAAGESALDMSSTLDRLIPVLLGLGRGTVLGREVWTHCLERGIRRNAFAPDQAASRAVDLLLAKVGGRGYRTELAAPRFPPVTPAPPAPARGARVALLTTGGLVPRGNPDRLEASSATKWLAYSIAGQATLRADEFECIHAGIDSSAVNQDPNRLVPLDVCRDLESEGVIGGLHPTFFTTVGNLTAVATAEQIGRQFAAHLIAAEVQAAILTST